MSANFSFDAWRTASNWSVDWAWWGKDARERQLSDRIQRFFVSQGISSYGDQFTLPGIPLENRHSTGLVATNAVASLAATGPQAAQFVQALWNAQVPSGEQRYYDGMLYLLSLLHCSGQFRIWTPQAAPTPSTAPGRVFLSVHGMGVKRIAQPPPGARCSVKVSPACTVCLRMLTSFGFSAASAASS